MQHSTDTIPLYTVLPKDVFQQLTKVLHTPLPLTFRISALLTNEQTQLLLQQLAVKPTKVLECYTFKDITKQTLQKQQEHNKLHRFLIAMTEAGYTTRQECVSMIPAIVLQVKKNMNVLDMCAAPGMKTSQIVENCGQDGGKKNREKQDANIRNKANIDYTN